VKYRLYNLGMKRLTRVMLGIAAALMLAGMGTCYFGVRYAEAQIPPEIRAGMEDTDWVGFEWIERGMYLSLIAFGVGVSPLLLNLVRRLYPR
jgi:hypothetical protein